MSEPRLTRERRDSGATTTNCVTLSIIGCNRGESEFYYEILLDLMNKVPELKKEYYEKNYANVPD